MHAPLHIPLRFTALPNGHNVMQGLAADNTDGPDAIVHTLQLAKLHQYHVHDTERQYSLSTML